jgi:hypothetical protein
MEVFEKLLTPSEVAELLRTTVGGLARKRTTGVGPPYLKVDGSVRYRPSDVAAWLDARTHQPEAKLTGGAA